MIAELIVVLAAILVAIASVKFYPEETKQRFNQIRKARMIIVGLMMVFFAFVFIRTGSPFLVIAGFLMLLYASLIVVLEKPHEQIRSVIQ